MTDFIDVEGTFDIAIAPHADHLDVGGLFKIAKEGTFTLDAVGAFDILPPRPSAFIKAGDVRVPTVMHIKVGSVLIPPYAPP